MRKLTSKGVVFSIAFGIACIWWLSSRAPSPPPHQDSQIPIASKPAASSVKDPIAQKSTSDNPLTHDETISAYSNYIGFLQSQLLTTKMMEQVYLSKIKQSMRFNDLDGYRTNAEGLVDYLKRAQSNIWQRQPQINILDADMDPFNNAQSAASDLISSYLSVATDIAVNAHTGMDSPSDDTHDVSTVKASTAKFRSAVLSGYKHFGVKRSDIAMDSLVLKAGTPSSE